MKIALKTAAAAFTRRSREGRATRAAIRGFSLLEMLCVIAIMALLAGWMAPRFTGTGPAILRDAQFLVADIVTAARLGAASSGRKVRILVNNDPAAGSRYLRLIAVQRARQPGPAPVEWDTVTKYALADGVALVPASLEGLVTDPAAWKKTSDPALDLISSVFQSQAVITALEGEPSGQLWTGFAFTPFGTIASLAGGPPPKGSLVLARMRRQTPDPANIPPIPPLELIEPQGARGLVLGAYGIPALIDDARGF